LDKEMELTFSDEEFYCWGRESQGGTYLLRLLVSQPLSVRFGRFQAGKPVAVPQGNYLYVGSALAQKGATSLARRLLRHASRNDGQNPQPIRQKMLDLFPKIGLGPTPLHPPTGKKLRWHVDFLLEELDTQLTAVSLIRSPQRLEEPLSRWLLDLLEVAPLVPGLGATDDPGSTHLLRVTAVSDWWTSFPAQLSAFLRSKVA
jgi:Uri superfamily endonuclease